MNSNRAVRISTMIYIINHQFISIQQTVLSKKYYHLQKIQFKFYIILNILNVFQIFSISIFQKILKNFKKEF